MIVIRWFVQTVVSAFAQIWANRARSILTSLGIIVATALVLSVIGAITGMKNYVLNEFQTVGARMIFMDGTVPASMENKVSWLQVQMTEEECNAILENCPSIDLITPHWYGAYEVRHGEDVKQVVCWGIWETWHEINNRYCIKGRPFSKIDRDEARQVCIINETAIEEFNLNKDPVGDFLLIKNRRFLIVGVVETKVVSPMFGGGQARSEIYIPFEQARKLNANGWINYCLARVVTPESANDAQAEARFVLRSMRKLQPDEEDTFVINVMQQFIDGFKKVAGIMTAVLAGIVGISLVVGGVGIMNIMLVSVSERTREIGLRKAVGARPAVILAQFLVEAVAMCIVGGALGMILAQLLMVAFSFMPNAQLSGSEIPLWAIVLAVGFSVGTGLLFGILPAFKASRLDPIDALRHE
ncbi:MAG: ABC transporter permease [Phycisphaeraceae bacterium]|nr:ABC transporter permease [Phycisphaeraceae bacterium]